MEPFTVTDSADSTRPTIRSVILHSIIYNKQYYCLADTVYILEYRVQQSSRYQTASTTAGILST